MTTSPDGYMVNFTPSWRKIQGTDAYGDAVVEAIWRGFKDVGVKFVSKEWKAGVTRAMNPAAPYLTTGATTFGAGLVGRRLSDMGGSLIMTSTTGTPAAASPATATFAVVAVRDGVNIGLRFDSTERDVPLDFEVMASTDGNSPPGAQYWSATAILIGLGSAIAMAAASLGSLFA